MTPFAALLSALLALVSLLPAPAQAQQPNTVTCALSRDGDHYRGQCSIPCLVNALAIDIDGPNPKATCTAPPRTVAATLRRTEAPGHWLGTMEGKFPEDPTRFEAIEAQPGTPGVAKLPFGWFPLTAMQAGDDGLHLAVAANKQLPPTADDLRIVRRAMALLPDAAAWNREDTRICPPGARTRSLFCALEEATTEVSGGIHYRQPALQAAREEVARVFPRTSKHRLMEFNNDPATALDTVQGVLRATEAKLEARMR